MEHFNKPSPENALQATFAALCSLMQLNTGRRDFWLSRSASVPLISNQVLSRYDIENVFHNSKRDLGNMCDGIQCIRIQPIWEEREDWELHKPSNYQRLFGLPGGKGDRCFAAMRSARGQAAEH